MVPSIARQSVMIKCNMQTSVLTGNYELYYVAGLISKLEGVEVTPDLKPLELLETLQEKTKDLHPEDEREAYLIKLVHDYKPDEAYDDQTRELFEMGKNEQNLWQVVIS